VRFPELVRLARRQGCALAATGHYARVAVENGQARLLRGVDPGKDQSYFLHRIDRAHWQNLVFPLGWYEKPDVRRAARELGLKVADKRDSQEICFVPDDDRSFLFEDGQSDRAGAIIDSDGRELGRHRGLVHYTVGQRRGLGVAAPEPLYVIGLDVQDNAVIVGTRDELDVDRFEADGFVAAVDGLPVEGPPPGMDGVVARIRHRHDGTPVRRWHLDGEQITVELEDCVAGGAPGQGLVLYAGDTVLGGGRILKATRRQGDVS